MSFTLREFPRKAPLDVWHVFPLHIPDMTDLLADCSPDYGTGNEQRRVRQEAEANAKVAEVDRLCERLMGEAESILREDAERELRWSTPTLNKWLDKSEKFMRKTPPGGGKALIVRRPLEDDDD